MKKGIAMLLATVMLLSCFGVLPAMAAEEIVLFESDFEVQNVGDKPNGMYTLENEENKFLVRVGETDGGKALFVHHGEGCECGKSSGPFGRVAVDFTKYKDLTLTFRVKSADRTGTLTLHNTENGQVITLFKAQALKWAKVEAKLDLEKSTYTVAVDGKESASGSLNDFGMPEAAQFRFSGSMASAGLGVYYDDIKFVSSGMRETAYVPPVVEVPDDVFAPTTAAEKTKAPSGMYATMDTDFSNATVATAKATKLTVDGIADNPFSTATDYANVVDVNGDKMLRFGALDGKVHGPYVRFSMDVSGGKYVVNFAVARNQNGQIFLELFQKKTSVAKFLSINNKTEGAKGEWHYVHLELDMETGTASGDVNGKAIEPVEFTLDGKEGIELSFSCSTNNNAYLYVDNVQIYAQKKPTVDTMFVGKKIHWENVKPSKPIDATSFVSNLKAHPRVFVTDWDAMRAKVGTDYYTKRWYNGIKKEADSAKVGAMVEWKLNSRNNVLESARAAKVRLIALAFVGMIEQDYTYLDRAYEEALYYGAWPDWSGFNSTFVTAQILEGYACLYDWGYDYFTAEQKQKLLEIMKAQGIPDFLWNLSNGTGFAGESGGNWNPVCNEALTATALAIAGEEPLVAEHILEVSPPNVWKVMWEYSPEGSYEETVSYWNAGTMNLAFITWFLDNAFVDGFELPASHRLSDEPNLALTAEFPIYGHGPAGMFNYGDCVPGYQSSPAIYWAAATYDKPQYAWWANNLQVQHGANFDGQYTVATLCFYDPDKAYYVAGAFPLDKFYTVDGFHNAAWLRSSWNDSTAVYAAMQGGPVGGHQHLSLGTYVIDYMGKRFIRQINYYDYALDFGDLTLAYYRRGEGYNTLIANPTRGEDILEKGVAKQIAHGTSENTAFGVFDMTSTNKDYTDAKRGIMLTDNRRRVIVQDEVKANKPSEFYWFANTDASVKIAPDGKSALLTMGEHNMLARIVKGPEEAKFELVERKSLFADVNNTITGDEGEKLQLHFVNKTELELCVEYIALKDGEGIPAPWAYTKMENWTANDNDITAKAAAGSNVVLKLGTPNAIANGVKTMVDTANADVVPFTENGRTLVPVRFISEAFGAKVGWDAATQAVKVSYLDKEIQLVIGSNEMKVNGETVLLDVPANTYNSRTLIPLRALVEALGMKVFWDDRGLISIGIADATYTEEQIVKLISELDTRVLMNGKDVAFFELAQTAYAVDLKSGEAVPTFTVYANGAEVPVTQATALGESASFSVAGKTYSFLMQPYAFEGIIGHKDPGVICELSIATEGLGKPDYDTFIYVEDLSDSTNWEKYPKRGIVDGVINSEVKNRWASEGAGEWISVDFGSVKNVHSMAFSGVSQDVRAYNFDVMVSDDNVNWITVHTGGAPTTTDFMSILPLGNVQARYVKLVGYGSNQSAWNTWAEIRFYESAAQQAEDISYWPIYFDVNGVEGSVGSRKKIIVEGSDIYRTKCDIRPDAIVTYAIADTSIATVSADGIVTFVAAGETTLTVAVTQDGYSVTSTVPVVAE